MPPDRPRRLRGAMALLAVFGLGAMATAIACGETLVATDTMDASADGAPSSPDGTTDGSDPSDAADASDDVTDAAIDVGEFDLEPTGACPRPLQGVACTGVGLGMTPCVGKTLFDPMVAEHVFQIVADRRHAFWLAQRYDADSAPGGAYNGNALAILRRVDRATGAVEEIARDLRKSTILYAYGPNLFWAAETPGGAGWEISTMRKDVVPCTMSGCAGKTTTIANGLGRIFHMAALDMDHVFAVAGSGSIVRIDIAQATKDVVGNVSGGPALTVVDDVAVYAGGAAQLGIESFAASGAQIADLGDLPDGAAGGLFLATTCKKVFVRNDDNRIFVIDAGSDGGSFIRHSSLPNGFLTYSVASDERFVYYGGANFAGLRRVDTTVPDAAPVEIAQASVWGVAVTDDAIIYGTHGETGSTGASDIGSIISISKK